MRTLVIGDIHGCLTALEALIDFVKPTTDDTIIFVGDYIDRGPDSKGVIDYIIELQKKYKVITLTGNHELMIMEARHDQEQLYFWLINGGVAAAESFGIESLEEMPKTYWDFMESCALYHETKNHIIVHAGLDPDLPLKEQDTESLCWLRINDTEPHVSGKTIVCGHTPQRKGKPLKLPHAICIDTHAFGNKWLTCLDIDSGQYWQAGQNKKTRTASV